MLKAAEDYVVAETIRHELVEVNSGIELETHLGAASLDDVRILNHFTLNAEHPVERFAADFKQLVATKRQDAGDAYADGRLEMARQRKGLGHGYRHGAMRKIHRTFPGI